MAKYTVIIGDFADFPGVWNEVHVEADGLADVDVEAAARKAYDELCTSFQNELGQPLPCYTLVGIYHGHITNVGVY